MHVHNDELPAAIHVLDKLVRRSAGIEASAFLASLMALPPSQRALSTQDAAAEQVRAKEMFEKVLRMIENGAGSGAGGVASDRDMFIEIARLWQKDSAEKATKALAQAVKLAGTPDARLLNNMAVMRHMEGELAVAKTGYEEAAMVAGSGGSGVGDSEDVVTTILYNLGRLNEDIGDLSMAGEVYDKILARHPEYVDGKSPFSCTNGKHSTLFLATLRKAQLYLSTGRGPEAASLIKRVTHSQQKDLNVRAFASYFAFASDQISMSEARGFIYTTLNTDSTDAHALCAAAWMNYQMARENRDQEPTAGDDRSKRYGRAIGLYKQVLDIDPTCAVAAQGLAIMIAEDVMGSAVNPGQAQEDARGREVNLRDALGIFAKVRESLADGSVYCNMGHCYFLREEYDRALECVSICG